MTNPKLLFPAFQNDNFFMFLFFVFVGYAHNYFIEKFSFKFFDL